MRKKNIAILIPIFIIILIIQFVHSDTINRFLTKTTDLENENIDNIKITDSINSPFFISKFSNYINDESNDMFYFDNPNIKSYRLNFNEKKAPIITVGFNEKTNEIVYISKYSHESQKKTLRDYIGNKEMHLGSNLNDVIDAYGNNYYKYPDEEGHKGIQYVDKKNKLNVIFLYDNQNNIYFYSIEKY